MATNVTYMLGIDAGASAGFAGAGWVWPYPVADRHSCAPGLAVGYVPQRLAVSHTLPLSLRRLMKLTAPFPAREIDAALAAVGLDRLGHPPVTSLSGGELQRLLLAGALIHRPDLLVLDEPAQGVDIAGAGVLHELIEGIRSDLGCGILLISHDLQMVMNSDSVVVVLLPHEHDDSPFGAAAAAQSAEHRERTGPAVAMLDDFLFRALLAGVGLALVTGPAGCFVVWRHLSYFGARYRSPLCRQPRADGRHRRCGRRRRDSRRSVRLGSPGHLFRPSIVVAALLLFAVTRFRRPQLAPRSRS